MNQNKFSISHISYAKLNILLRIVQLAILRILVQAYVIILEATIEPDGKNWYHYANVQYREKFNDENNYFRLQSGILDSFQVTFVRNYALLDLYITQLWFSIVCGSYNTLTAPFSVVTNDGHFQLYY
ncbi:Hypothetical_protein [Hexamita inflata]|uniref:Hypothetical_protein n=1 Tax=Hexamita inflata TaxID=28002 RepID=A0ABP1H4W2_9EUKA